jgi:HAD superfamily hydrolase (TIGR01484 family)
LDTLKLSVLALDYDGTIARDDRLDPAVREAIAEARRRGVKVMLVTGRILGDLQRVAGELAFVDGVVAENGAIVHFPNGGLTAPLAPPLPRAFAAGLNLRNAEFRSRQASALLTRMRAPLRGCLMSFASSSFRLHSCSIEAVSWR